MKISKVFAVVAVALGLVAETANAAITDAVVDSSTGVSLLAAGGIITNIDGDGDGLEDDLSIASITFTISGDDYVTVSGEVDGFIGYMYLFAEGNPLPIFEEEDFNGFTYFSGELAAGTYMVTLGAVGYLPDAAMLGYDQDQAYSRNNIPGTNEEFGNWSLVITATSTEVPLPASAYLFLSALIGVAGVARRNK